MRVTILGSGTSTGVPEIGCSCDVCKSENPKDKRLRASVLVETGSENLLIDCGPDFRYQMLRNRTTAVDALLITHIHYDHIGGLDDLRPFCKEQAFPVFAEKRVTDALREKYSYIFQDHRYPGVPDINLITIHRNPFQIGNTEIIPIRLFHYKLPVLGFRIGDFAYLTDFTTLPEAEMVKLEGVRVVIMEALRKTPHMSHLSLGEALEIASKLNAEQIVLTHISHQMGMHEEVNKELPDGVSLGYDRMTLSF